MFKEGVAKRKPDLTIITKGEARVFVDLKMDLGYKRQDNIFA